MPAKWHKYSYSAQRAERLTVISIILLFAFLYIVYAVINLNFLNMYNIEASTMSPTILSGDCVIATPLYRNEPGASSHFSLLIAPQRGDLVVIAPAYGNDSNKALQVLNAMISFLTFQKFRPFDHKDAWGEKPFIRRLVAFPGDSLYMDNFILHVKTGDSAHYLTEFETSINTYDITAEALPENWTADLPFSGSFAEIKLTDNQFFVLCDNRKNSSDSRIWGPISRERIKGKVLYRYWPFSHIGSF